MGEKEIEIVSNGGFSKINEGSHAPVRDNSVSSESVSNNYYKSKTNSNGRISIIKKEVDRL